MVDLRALRVALEMDEMETLMADLTIRPLLHDQIKERQKEYPIRYKPDNDILERLYVEHIV